MKLPLLPGQEGSCSFHDRDFSSCFLGLSAVILKSFSNPPAEVPGLPLPIAVVVIGGKSNISFLGRPCRVCPVPLQCSSSGTSRCLPSLTGLERCRLSANAVCRHLLPPPPLPPGKRQQLPSKQPALCITPRTPDQSSLLLLQTPLQDLEMVVSPVLAWLQAAFCFTRP